MIFIINDCTINKFNKKDWFSPSTLFVYQVTLHNLIVCRSGNLNYSAESQSHLLLHYTLGVVRIWGLWNDKKLSGLKDAMLSLLCYSKPLLCMHCLHLGSVIFRHLVKDCLLQMKSGSVLFFCLEKIHSHSFISCPAGWSLTMKMVKGRANFQGLIYNRLWHNLTSCFNYIITVAKELICICLHKQNTMKHFLEEFSALASHSMSHVFIILHLLC